MTVHFDRISQQLERKKPVSQIDPDLQ